VHKIGLQRKQYFLFIPKSAERNLTFLLLLGPGVFQSDRPVENQVAWLAVGIGAEIAFPQELKMSSIYRIGQRWFRQCFGDNVKGVGIDIIFEITFF
jgi:hypothetical protein